MSEPQIKGASMQATMRFILERFGPEAHERILAELRPEYAARLREPLVANEPLPIRMMVEYDAIADRLLGKGDLELCYQAGRFTAYESVSALYKLVMQLSTPLSMVKRVASMWGRFVSQGELSVADSGEGFIVLHLEGLPPQGEGYCRRLAGWFSRLIEVTGGKHPNITHHACRCRGDSRCVFTCKWS